MESCEAESVWEYPLSASIKRALVNIYLEYINIFPYLFCPSLGFFTFYFFTLLLLKSL